MYVQALAMAYNGLQPTTDDDPHAAMAAERSQTKILKALNNNQDLLESYIALTMARRYDPDELAAIHKLELEVLLNVLQQDMLHWEEAALELMPPTYEELTKESDAVLQEYDAMLA
jgi:hypothetical protein